MVLTDKELNEEEADIDHKQQRDAGCARHAQGDHCGLQASGEKEGMMKGVERDVKVASLCFAESQLMTDMV